MAESRWRAGIVGTGHIAPFHLAAIQSSEHAQPVAVYDPNVERATELVRSDPRLVLCRSFEELLRQVDVVHVLTPPASHGALAEQALHAGCHVFVEKPLANSVAECDRIIAAATASGKFAAVDHSLLRDPFTQQAQSLVARGRLGQVVAVQCFRSQEYPEYAGGPLPAYANEPGFPFRDLGIHALYQIELFLGPIARLQGEFRKLGDDPQMAFDEWSATVHCAQGTAQFHLSWNVRPLQDLIWVHGTQGSLRIDRFGMHVTRRLDRGLPEHPQRLLHAMEEAAQSLLQVPYQVARIATGRLKRYHGLQTMVAEFYAAISQGRQPAADPHSARRLIGWVEHLASAADQAADRATDRTEQPSDNAPQSMAANVAELAPEARSTARTLVTGANGFIGRHLVQRLVREGRAVRALCRRTPPSEWNHHPMIEVVRGDMGDPQAVRRALEGIETVYHAAGAVHGSQVAMHRGNVVATQNLVDACLAFGIRQLIYVSSLSVLASPDHELDSLDESSAYEPRPEQRGTYTQTKLAAEKIVMSAIRDHRLPAVILRPGEVIGAGAPLFSPGIGRRVGDWVIVFGDGQLEVPLIHVDDLVDAMLRCEQQQIQDGTVIHLVDPQSMDQNELLARYQQLADQTLRVIHLPRWSVYGLALLGQLAAQVLRRPHAISLYRFRSALAHRRFSVDRAAERLDWRPQRGVLQGLRDAAAATRG